MKSPSPKLLAAVAMLALVSTIGPQISTALAQGTAFTYQGQLQNNGSPANGTFNLQFLLYTIAAGGTPVAGPVTTNGLVISNGLFTVTMDFGAGVWSGPTNWLEIAVETNGVTFFATLTPRQQLTPAPCAITAENLNGRLPSNELSGKYENPVFLNNSTNQFAGGFTGNGGGLTNVNAATLDGLSASNFWRLGSGGPGIQTNGGAGTKNTFTNITLVTTANQSAGVVFTNDLIYGNYNSLQDVDEEFYGISETNNAMLLFVGPAGWYGSIIEDPTHDGTPALPSASELTILSANRIAIIPNDTKIADSGTLQLGGAGTPAIIYINSASNTLYSPSPSIPLIFQSGALTSSNSLMMFEPGLLADWPNPNVREGHFYIFHDTGAFGNENFMPDKNLEIRGADFYIGTSSNGTTYTGVELFGRNGHTTNTLRVDTNGITMTGNVTAQGGTVSAGIVIAPTNAAPLTVVSNFSPSPNTLYTNVLQARIEVSGSISCQAGANSPGATENATALVNYTNNGVGAAPLEVGSTAQGANTNAVVCPFRFDLGPGGTFEIGTSIVGNGSAVGFPQNVTFIIE